MGLAGVHFEPLAPQGYGARRIAGRGEKGRGFEAEFLPETAVAMDTRTTRMACHRAAGRIRQLSRMGLPTRSDRRIAQGGA